MKSKVPHRIDVIVGNNIRMLRNQRKVSQSTLADTLGLTFQQVQKYEKGANRISASKLYDIAQYFDVGVSVFYAGTDDADKDINPILPFGRDTLDVARAFESLDDPKLKTSIKGLVKAAAGK